MSDGVRQRAKKGRSPSGPPPLGYDLNQDTGCLVGNPEEAEVVRQISRIYHNEAIGIRRVARRIKAQGLRTRNVDQFLVSTLQQMLTNPVYRGKIRHNEDIELEGGHRRRAILSRGETSEHHMEDACSSKAFEAAVAGIAKCRTCGKLPRTHHKNENNSFYRRSGNTRVGEVREVASSNYSIHGR